MFEPVSDSEYSHDGKSTLYESECDVEVLPENLENINPFKEINQIEKEFKTNSQIITTDLSIWWPNTAKKILYGFHANKEAKNAAVKSLMHLFEYKYTNVSTLKLPTHELTELRSLYGKKLNTLEMYAIQVKNDWCDLLRNCANQCKNILKEQQNTKYFLKKKAIDIINKHKNNPVVIQIVKEEFKKSEREIDYVSLCKVKLTKTNLNINDNVQHLCKLHDINNSIDALIKKLLHDYDEHVFKQMENAFMQECANIDYELAKQLQRECQEYWLDALT